MTKMGRPRFPKGKARGAIFAVRLSPVEREAIEKAAEQEKMSASEWARRVLLERVTIRG
jgi:predicted HicB family RNase H-like nuclease